MTNETAAAIVCVLDTVMARARKRDDFPFDWCRECIVALDSDIIPFADALERLEQLSHKIDEDIWFNVIGAMSDKRYGYPAIVSYSRHCMEAAISAYEEIPEVPAVKHELERIAAAGEYPDWIRRQAKEALDDMEKNSPRG